MRLKGMYVYAKGEESPNPQYICDISGTKDDMYILRLDFESPDLVLSNAHKYMDESLN